MSLAVLCTSEDVSMCVILAYMSCSAMYWWSGTCTGIVKGHCSALEKSVNTLIFVTAAGTPPPPAHIFRDFFYLGLQEILQPLYYFKKINKIGRASCRERV